MVRRSVKIAYIGGGSKAWARSFMQDLALAGDLAGEVALYDIDVPAARRNQIIGTKIQQKAEALSDFRYTVSGTLESALTGADFVIISILPGTFAQMHTDVHAPEAYGILQSVGDTVGPGGVFRALRTVPVYEEFAEAIRDCCPDAWVLNLTNPMSICVKTLCRCFPQIKAFGCCHEVFHTQDFLCCVLREMTGESVTRSDIYTDASGINHFTWITEARYRDIDLMELMPAFMERYFDTGYYENGPADQWMHDTFAYGNRVKTDLLKKYGALAAAGDRHLVEFIDALIERLEFFAKLGCRASDHGLDYIPFRPAPMEEVDAVYKKVMAGEAVTVEEAEKYQTAVLLALAKAYHRLGIAMQIHYSCYRNANERIFRKMGPDTGVDMIAQNTCGEDIAHLLSALDLTNECPKTIIYSLNPADDEQIGTMLGCFQSDEVPGKIQHGSAWWFNDTKSGMEEQMKSLANLGLLGNFVGMLTDSRSFLSYARHDYFRRIMCNLIGNWVENGEYPGNEASLKKIVEGISYKNAARYFGI